jgi:hypothetical protein
MNLRLSAWATGILLAVVTVACGGGGGQTASPSQTPAGSGNAETATPASPTTNSSALKPFTVRAGPPYGSTSPDFFAFAELVNDNAVPVDIDSVTLTLLDASGQEIARSEPRFGVLTARPTDPNAPYIIGGQRLELGACDAPIAPNGEMGLRMRIPQAPTGIASYQLEVNARETHVTGVAFSVSDVVQSADESNPTVTATRVDANVTNQSAETQRNVAVCCGLYNHDLLYSVATSFFSPLPPIGSLAPGESAPFRCVSNGDPSVLQPKFWVTSQALGEQLNEEWSNRPPGDQ